MANSCCLIIPNSKNGASHTDEGTSLFYRYGIVVGHAHGDLFEILMICKKVFLERLEDVVQVAKFPTHLLHVFGEGSHTHHAANLHVVQGGEDLALEHLAALLQGKAELGGFLCNMELEQAGNHALVFSRQLIDFHQQRFTVNTMDHRHIGGDVFDLVGLQVADEVPLDILGQHLVFGLHFLGLVLAEQSLALVIQHLDILHRFGFGDGNQSGAVG